MFVGVFAAWGPDSCIVRFEGPRVPDGRWPYKDCKTYLGVSLRQGFNYGFSVRPGQSVSGNPFPALALATPSGVLAGLAFYLALRVRQVGLDELLIPDGARSVS